MGSAAPYVNLLCWHKSKPVTTPDWSTNWCSVSFTISQNVIHLSPYKKGHFWRKEFKLYFLHIFISYFMHSKTLIVHGFYTHINYFWEHKKSKKAHGAAFFITNYDEFSLFFFASCFCKYSSLSHKCLKCLKNAVLKHE